MCHMPEYIAKCCTDRVCMKCGFFGDAIVVNTGKQYGLYCSTCGSFIKRANKKDKEYTYLWPVVPTDIPTKVRTLYIQSAKTMTTK